MEKRHNSQMMKHVLVNNATLQWNGDRHRDIIKRMGMTILSSCLETLRVLRGVKKSRRICRKLILFLFPRLKK
ncbi:hypothetical protein L2E82_10631 [Cichorium intybus]|uniref:Uncharacterized protein n=1 Tax=Cichorium intybus TaxID=13427 RepID=A0ACB9GC45_CICIN|nr:hypothetical protein L2E82_10631 [Cichorium intybus]